MCFSDFRLGGVHVTTIATPAARLERQAADQSGSVLSLLFCDWSMKEMAKGKLEVCEIRQTHLSLNSNLLTHFITFSLYNVILLMQGHNNFVLPYLSVRPQGVALMSITFKHPRHTDAVFFTV